MTQWQVEFLNNSVESEFDSFPPAVKAKIVHIAKLISQFGLPNIGMPYVRHVQDKIWEIRATGKTEQGRCLYVAVAGQQVVILRCFLKKSGKLPRKELAIALKRAKELPNG